MIDRLDFAIDHKTIGDIDVRSGVIAGMLEVDEASVYSEEVHYEAASRTVEGITHEADRIAAATRCDPVPVLMMLGGVEGAKRKMGEEATATLLKLIRESEAELESR